MEFKLIKITCGLAAVVLCGLAWMALSSHELLTCWRQHCSFARGAQADVAGFACIGLVIWVTTLPLGRSEWWFLRPALWGVYIVALVSYFAWYALG